MKQTQFNDTEPDEYGFTDRDIITIIENGGLENWRPEEQEYIKKRYKEIKNTKIDTILKKYGAFWAFGEEQFDEQKKYGVKYVSFGMGLMCPKENVQKLNSELFS